MSIFGLWLRAWNVECSMIISDISPQELFEDSWDTFLVSGNAVTLGGAGIAQLDIGKEFACKADPDIYRWYMYSYGS